MCVFSRFLLQASVWWTWGLSSGLTMTQACWLHGFRLDLSLVRGLIFLVVQQLYQIFESPLRRLQPVKHGIISNAAQGIFTKLKWHTCHSNQFTSLVLANPSMGVLSRFLLQAPVWGAWGLSSGLLMPQACWQHGCRLGQTSAHFQTKKGGSGEFFPWQTMNKNKLL
jgi:hypothetical protein